jgi:tetratricopeptide (TPR) repeat protein
MARIDRQWAVLMSASLLSSALALAVSIDFSLCTRAQAGPPMTMFEQGCDQMMRKSFREAIATFTEALANSPTDANCLFRRGQCFYIVQDIKLAIADFDRAIAVKDDNYQVYLWRGSALAKQGNDTKAIDDYERALRLNAGLIEAYNQQKMGDSLNPSIPTLSKSKSDSISLGSNENAVKDYAEAVKRATDAQTGYFYPGATYGGIVVTSSEAGERKILYQPAKENNEYGHKFNREYLTLKNPKKDADDRTATIDAYPETPVAFFERGRDFEMMGANTRAQADFLHAIELRPKEVMYYLGRAYFYHLEGKDDLGMADVKMAQELDPSLPRQIAFEFRPKEDTMSRKP